MIRPPRLPLLLLRVGRHRAGGEIPPAEVTCDHLDGGDGVVAIREVDLQISLAAGFAVAGDHAPELW
ncbi:MAG: hypothetical protein R3F14_24800 [Polyangiaceae bacterium]